MKINLFGRQTFGAWAVAAFLAGTTAIGVSNLFPADEPAAPKADDFSPYVAKDGAISLPADYRNKFEHLGTWAVATKPDKPADKLHISYTRQENITETSRPTNCSSSTRGRRTSRHTAGTANSPTARCW